MIKVIIGVLAGLFGWAIVGFIGLFALRMSWPEYASAINDFSFTVPMLLARSAVGLLSSFAAGWSAYAASKNIKLVWGLGIFLLVYASYMHFVVLWPNFPAWFHFSYIITLLPLVVLGGYIEQCRVSGALKASVA